MWAVICNCQRHTVQYIIMPIEDIIQSLKVMCNNPLFLLELEKQTFIAMKKKGTYITRSLVISICHQKASEEELYWNSRGREKDWRLIKDWQWTRVDKMSGRLRLRVGEETQQLTIQTNYTDMPSYCLVFSHQRVNKEQIRLPQTHLLNTSSYILLMIYKGTEQSC